MGLQGLAQLGMGLPSAAAASQGQVYQPLLPRATVNGLAVVTELTQEAILKQSAGERFWATMFWLKVAGHEGHDSWDPRLKALLVSHGYREGSPQSSMDPDPAALLRNLELLGGAAVGGLGGAPAATSEMAALAEARLSDHLPKDLKRAGPEIYKSLMESATSAREYLMQHYEGSKKSPQWIDLWSTATSIDLLLAQSAGLPGGRDLALQTSDTLEVALRRLASYFHAHRTGDAVAATRMLASKPPGATGDIAPEWLVSEAGTYAQSEFKRQNRVQQIHRWQQGGQQGAGKGKGKGKGKKKSEGAPAGATQPQG